MTRYAAQTTVTPERSRGEIEKVLRRYGADGFMYGWEGRRALVGFRVHGRQVRFEVPMPSPDDDAIRLTPKRQRRSPAQITSALEQEERRRWRALALAIKAKLEVVESEIATFEEEFLAHILLPDGSTVGSQVLPAVERAYADEAMPKLLPRWSGEDPGDAIDGEVVS